MTKFSKKDLARIKRNTNDNHHIENYEFIADKIGSPTKAKFQQIKAKRDKDGYISGDTSTELHTTYTKLMQELKGRYPDEYQGVYDRT